MMRAARTRAVLTALLLAGTVALGGCSSDGGSAPSGQDGPGKPAGDSAEAPQKDAQEGVAPGEKNPGGENTPAALEFTGSTVDGEPFRGSSLAGKPAVLWFWAPWCGTCKGQSAQTARLARKHRGKVNFVGVAGLDKTGAVRDFVRAQKVGGFPHIDDQKGAVWKRFGITRQSSYVMLDEKGQKVHAGEATTPGRLDRLVSGLVR